MLQFGEVFIGCCDGFLKMSGCRIHHNILLGGSVMAHEVVLPWRNTLANERQTILAVFLLLVDTYAELHLLACNIGERCVLGELIRHSAYCYAEQRSACLHSLRNYYGAPYFAHLRGNGCRRFHCTSRLDRSVSQIDARLAHHIGCEHSLLGSRPFAFGKAFALHQRDISTRHAVLQKQTYHVGGWSEVAHRAPKEVAGFISAHVSVVRCGALIALHLKLIVVNALGIGKRIITIHIDVSMLVLPIYVVGRVPLACQCVESVTHIISTIAAKLQGSGRAGTIVNDVHTHAVAVAESVVIDTSHCQLVDVARKLNAVATICPAVLAEQAVGTARQQHHADRNSHIYNVV